MSKKYSLKGSVARENQKKVSGHKNSKMSESNFSFHVK